MPRDPSEEVAAVRAWYDLTADRFRARYSGARGEFWSHFEEDLALELLGKELARILDLGCGPGRLASSLSRRAKAVVAVDIAWAMTAMGRANHPRSNVHYAVVDATAAALRSESFDAVISLGMFEYMADPSPFLTEIFRVLARGGTVVFTCHNRAPLPVRAWTYAGSMMRNAFSRPKAAGDGVARAAMFRTVRHEPGAMLQLLKSHGFVDADFRGFHFQPAADLFRIASRATGIRNGAVAIDRLIGRSRMLRRLSSLAMYVARKPR